MKTIDRCSICDYTETEGSFVTDKPPSPSNRVHWRHKLKGYYCDECYHWITGNHNALELDPDTNPFTLPITSL